jgi:hypothetical protein
VALAQSFHQGFHTLRLQEIALHPGKEVNKVEKIGKIGSLSQNWARV